jgi:nicotinate-nucleotide adenylyltransferase
VGHLFLADQVLQELRYDRVVFVPARQRPLKAMAEGATDDDRLEMLRLACKGNSAFTVDSCELERTGPSYTFDTVLHLEKKYAPSLGGKIGLIMGDDLLGDLDQWYRFQELLDRCDLILAHRLPEGSSPPLAYSHTLLSNAVLPMSSSDIRDRIAGGRSFRYLLPHKVYEYVQERGLYADAEVARVCARLATSLSKKRFGHSLRVAETARRLCRKYDLDERQGYFAGLAHDLCKEIGDDASLAMAKAARRELLPLEQEKPGLLHGWAAAQVLRSDFQVTDPELLEAVEFHTFGRVGMSDLAKVIYVADKIEPGRSHVNQEYLEKLQPLGLNELVVSVLEENIEFLVRKGKRVAAESFDLLESLGGTSGGKK